MSKVINAAFPGVMRDQLRTVRLRQAGFAALRAAAIATTILLLCMIAAMAIDWAVTLFDTRVRILLTSSCLIVAATVLILTAWKPVRQALGWTAAATRVDQRIPQMQERWQTVASLAESGHEPADAMTQAMLARVRNEAVAMSRLVHPRQVIDAKILRRPAMGAAASVVAMSVFMASHWGQTSVLWQRFWSPTLNISATQLQSLTGDIVVPRGTTIEVIAQMDGLQRQSVDLILRGESSTDAEVTLTAAPVIADASKNNVTFSVDVDETLSYRVQAGDGRSEWHQIKAIDFPELRDVRLTLTPPKYVDEPAAEKTLIPSRLRAVQGSYMELAIKPQVELKSLTLKIAIPVAQSDSTPSENEVPVPSDQPTGDAEVPAETTETLVLTRGDDGWYRFETSLVESFSFTPFLVSDNDLQNKNPRVCRVEVVEDHAPVARIVSPNGESTVGSNEKLDIRFEAHDDHGIATAELVIYQEAEKEGDPPKVLEVRQIPLGDQAMQKHVMSKVELDLKELGLPEGATISYSVRVTDNRSLDIEGMKPSEPVEAMVAANDFESADRSDMKAEDPASSSPDAESRNGKSPDSKTSDGKTPDGQNGDSKNADAQMADANRDDESTNAAKNASKNDSANENSNSGKVANDKTGDEEKTDSADAVAKNQPVKTPEEAMPSTGSDKPESSETSKDQPDGQQNPSDQPSLVAKKDSAEQPQMAEGQRPSDKSQSNQGQSNGDPSRRSDANTKTGVAEKKSDNHPAEELLNAMKKNGETADDKAPESALANNESDSNNPQGSANPNKKSSTSTNPSSSTNADNSNPKNNSENKSIALAKGDPKDTKHGDTKEPQLNEEATSDELTAKASAPKQASDMKDAAETKDDKPPGEITLAGEFDNPDDRKSQNTSSSDREPSPSQSSQLANANVPRISEPNNNGSNSIRPKVNLKLNPQASDSGQQQETDRRRLRIVSMLEAVAKSEDPRRDQTKPVREKVVQIDEMLQVIENKLGDLYRHKTDEALRGEGFQEIDVRLKDVEDFIIDLDKSTQETVFEFVGLQMIDISSTHIAPSRDAIFIAVRRPDSGADVPAEEALHHVVSAREQLQALLKRYDSVAREKELAEKMNEAVKMYTVYVERSQRLMREAQQNRDPFRVRREMAIVEVDQAYMDRLAEVTRMRRDMMTELARILADDPRLRSRYLDLIRRRRSSIGNQLAELASRQDQTAQEVIGWISVDENQRESYWIQISDLRLDGPNAFAKETQQLAERIEKQLPLVLDPGAGSASVIISTAKDIALDARRCDLAVRDYRKSENPATALSLSSSADALAFRVNELLAALDQLQFEASTLEGVDEYVQLRRIEVQALADKSDDWSVAAHAIEQKSFADLAALEQHQLAIATELLRVEMLGIEDDLSVQFNDEVPMPQEVINLTNDLHRVMESITHNQSSATFALSTNRLEDAGAQQELALESFEEAQKLLNQLRKKTAEALDKMTVQNPDIAMLNDPTLDQFLADLEREPNIEAQLGIPNRPSNIRVLQDAMTWRQNGAAMLGASGEGAMSRIQQMIQERLNGSEGDRPESKQTAELEEPVDPQKLTDEEKQQMAETEEMQKMLKERMEQAQKELERQANDPSKTDAERQKLAAMVAQMNQSMKEMQNSQTPEQLWRQMVEADQAKAMLEALASGEQVPDEQWNKLMSTLGDGVGQVTGRVPSEDYRRSIEQYQERIRQLTGSR